MKFYLAIIYFLFLSVVSEAQHSFTATYTISKPITMTVDIGKKETFILEYDGRVFKRGIKVFMYKRPLFLEENPTGKIIKTYQGGGSMYSFGTDSMVLPELYHLDSMQKWAGYNDAENSKLNEFFTLKFDRKYWKWEIQQETKIIRGFNCQRAKKYDISIRGDSTLHYDIWFSKDIPFEFGFTSIQSAPGLIIEQDDLQANEHTSLKSLEMNAIIPDEIFWPKMFQDAKFTDLGAPQTPQQKKKIKRDNERQVIMGQ
jgi:GLPGLI family protein